MVSSILGAMPAIISLIIVSVFLVIVASLIWISIEALTAKVVKILLDISKKR